jgi:glutamate synthase domain-containing protein 2
VGMPLTEGLIFVHNALRGAGLRDGIRVIASGRIVTGFDMARRMALGADLCNSARGMMFALGCIQALRCNANTCPTGVATQKPDLVAGLHVGDKAARVHRFQRNTVHAFMELLGAAGLEHPADLRPEYVFRRYGDSQVDHYGDLFEWLPAGALLDAAYEVPARYATPWERARSDRF